jgi:hypothetical protein
MPELDRDPLRRRRIEVASPPTDRLTRARRRDVVPVNRTFDETLDEVPVELDAEPVPQLAGHLARVGDEILVSNQLTLDLGCRRNDRLEAALVRDNELPDVGPLALSGPAPEAVDPRPRERPDRGEHVARDPEGVRGDRCRVRVIAGGSGGSSEACTAHPSGSARETGRTPGGIASSRSGL